MSILSIAGADAGDGADNSTGDLDIIDNPAGFPGLRYYCLSEQGRAFADQVCAGCQQLSVMQRLIVRLVG